MHRFAPYSNLFYREKFSAAKSDSIFPIIVCHHNSLIRRKLGNVAMDLQENKAVNLSLAAPKINRIVVFSERNILVLALGGKR